MDHHWDDELCADRQARSERDRYEISVVATDLDVERRDKLALQAREKSRHDELSHEPGPRQMSPCQLSPWEIGRAHYHQRDSYTRNGRIDELGYGGGPPEHPEEGSYAYVRKGWHETVSQETEELRAWGKTHGADLYAREAWPWLRYASAEQHSQGQGQVPQREQRAPLWIGDSTGRVHMERQSADASGESGDERQRRKTLPALVRGLEERLRELFGSASDAPPRQSLESEAVLRRDVYEQLWRHRELDPRDITVSVARGTVTLSGTVARRLDKMLAQGVAERCPGVSAVRNKLRVRSDDDASTPFALQLRT